MWDRDIDIMVCVTLFIVYNIYREMSGFHYNLWPWIITIDGKPNLNESYFITKSNRVVGNYHQVETHIYLKT